MLLIIEKLSIIALTHKEMFHLPLRTVNSLDLAISHHTQREEDALHLKLSVGRKIEHKIIEQLIGSLGHRQIFQPSQQRINRR